MEGIRASYRSVNKGLIGLKFKRPFLVKGEKSHYDRRGSMSRTSVAQSILLCCILLSQTVATASSYSQQSDIGTYTAEDIATIEAGSPVLIRTSIDATSGLIYGPNGPFDPTIHFPYEKSLQGNEGFNGMILAQSLTSDMSIMIEAIQEVGGFLQDFYPEDAAIFTIEPGINGLQTMEILAGHNSIRWVAPLPVTFRVDPLVFDDPVEVQNLDFHLIRGLNQTETKDLENILNDYSIPEKSDIWCDGRLCRASSVSYLSTVRMLADHRVMHISKSPVDNIFDASSRSIIGLDPTGISNPLDYDGEGQILSITDTGIDSDHPSLSDNVRAVYNQFGPDNSAADTNSGHGTHVTGIVVGNATGDNQTLGIAPEAQINFYQIEYDSSGLLARWGTLYSMFSHSLQNQARIHTNAWGSVNQPGEYTTDSHSADSFVIDQPSYLPLFSSGDLGEAQSASSTPPGTAKNVLTIGASTTGNGDSPAAGQHYTNNSGGTLDGRIKPDLVAPGVLICSTRAEEAGLISGETCSNAADPEGNPLYFASTGTSMATAVASGAVVILREHLYEEFGLSEPDSSLLKAMMINGATDLDQPDIPNLREGWGEVNIMRSIKPSHDGQELEVIIDYGRNLGTGDGLVQLVDVDGAPLDMTLVWTDHEGSVNAPQNSPRLVNNLNLVITSPSGVIYSGNSLQNGYSIPSNTSDSVNNVERFKIQEPEIGIWKVEVRNVAGTEQNGYSLVVSGDVSWIQHTDLTTSEESISINRDVIFEGEQLLIQTKWRNEGNTQSGSYSVELYDLTTQESIQMTSMPPLGAGETESWSVQHAFSSVGFHILELRLDVSSDIIESNDEETGSDNNIAQMEVLISKQGLEVIPVLSNGTEPHPDEYENASRRTLDVFNSTIVNFDLVVRNIGTSQVTISIFSTPVKQVMQSGALKNPIDEWTRAISDLGPITLSAAGEHGDNVSVSLSMVDESADPQAEGTPSYAVPGLFSTRITVKDIDNPTVMNSRSFLVEVPRVEGVQILASGLDDFSARPGYYASFDMAVLNTGNGETEYVVNCQSQSGWTSKIDSIVSGTVALPELARLEYLTIPIEILVPPASMGEPSSGYIEEVVCTVSSPTSTATSETVTAFLQVEESRDFVTNIRDGDSNILPPLAAAEDRRVLNLQAVETTLEITNQGNLDMNMGVTVSLSDSTWAVQAVLNPQTSQSTEIPIFDGSASFDVLSAAGSTIVISVSVVAPPTATKGDKALLTFRTGEGTQVDVVDSSRFVLQPTPQISLESPERVDSLSGQSTDIPIKVSNTGNMELGLSWSFITSEESWSTALQSIVPTSIQPNQNFEVVLSVKVPKNYDVSETGEKVIITLEATDPSAQEQVLVSISNEIVVSVLETCSFEIQVPSKISVEPGKISQATVQLYNTGNHPSEPRISYSKENSSFILPENYDNIGLIEAGDMQDHVFRIEASPSSEPGRRTISLSVKPDGVGCVTLNSSWDVEVDILPTSNSGFFNSLPPIVIPLIFISAIAIISLGVIVLKRNNPGNGRDEDDEIPETSALMRGDESARRMEAITTEAADETLSTAVNSDDLDAVLRDSLPKLDLPPLPGVSEDEENSD